MIGGDGAGGGVSVFSAFIAQLLAGNRVALTPPDGSGNGGTPGSQT